MLLRAIKPHKNRVRGRRITVGDTYEVSRVQGKALLALGVAEVVGAAPSATGETYARRDIVRAPERAVMQPERPVEAAPTVDPFDHDGDGHPGGSPKIEPSEDLTALRAEYFEVLGKRPFNGWGAEVLAEKIAEAKAAAE